MATFEALFMVNLTSSDLRWPSVLVSTGVQGNEGGMLSLWETLAPLGLQGSPGSKQQHPGQRTAFTRVPGKAGPCLRHPL